MNNFVTNAIASIASILKSLRLKQALVAALAGLLLLTSTACGGTSTTASSKSYDYNAAPGTTKANERPSKSASPYDKGTGPQRELYKPVQTPQGGMNDYNDDLRYEQKGANAKAQDLANRAENRLQKRAGNPQELVENARQDNPFPQGARDVARRVNSVTESAKENISDDLEKGSRNLKQNLRKAQETAPDVVDRAKDNAFDATRGVREGAQDVSRGVQRMGDRA
jgi:hypothetical protein